MTKHLGNPEDKANILRRLREVHTGSPRGWGKMSDQEWLRWGYLHMDHHLRQFGA